MSSVKKFSQRSSLHFFIGGIAIVTFGVLFALQLANWNSHRSDRFQERYLINQLNEELYRSLSWASELEEALNQKKEALDQLAPYLNGKPIENNAAFLALVLKAADFGWSQLEMKLVPFDEVIGSPKMDLIRDAELRQKVVRFHRAVDQRERNAVDRMAEFPSIAHRFIPCEREGKVRTDLSEEQLAEIVDDLLQSNLREFVIPEQNRAQFMHSCWNQINALGADLQKQISLTQL